MGKFIRMVGWIDIFLGSEAKEKALSLLRAVVGKFIGMAGRIAIFHKGRGVNRTKGGAKEAQTHHVFSIFAKVSTMFAKVLAGGTKISHFLRRCQPCLQRCWRAAPK